MSFQTSGQESVVLELVKPYLLLSTPQEVTMDSSALVELGNEVEVTKVLQLLYVLYLWHPRVSGFGVGGRCGYCDWVYGGNLGDHYFYEPISVLQFANSCLCNC